MFIPKASYKGSERHGQVLL